ncbi:MAG: DUF4428 domain-containing protein [Candidatus Limivivens sp.]|nr:DUF4428 domain-containing protein [Candidatus Limivivens sp.]
MGFFGKVFEKKECDICGGEIGLLGNRKLDDGNLCKECAKKLSPWFEERRRSTVEDIRKQLAYREENKEKVRSFQITRDLAGSCYHVFLDDTKGQFTVATRFDEESNPDIVDLSQVTSCKLEIREDRDEEQYEDQEGNLRSYNPPRYTYSYDYYIKLGIRSPWFDDMDFQLNSFSVKDHERAKMLEMENVGNQIVAALTGMPYSQPVQGQMNNGMYGQPVQGQMNSGMYGQPVQGQMNNGMYGQPVQGQMNNGMYGQPVQGQMNNGMYGQPVQGQMNNGMYGQTGNAGAWTCSCGAVNTGKFCQQCGQPAPSASRNTGWMQSIRCDKCGWTPEDPSQVPKFCPQCGDPIDGNDRC